MFWETTINLISTQLPPTEVPSQPLGQRGRGEGIAPDSTITALAVCTEPLNMACSSTNEGIAEAVKNAMISQLSIIGVPGHNGTENAELDPRIRAVIEEVAERLQDKFVNAFDNEVMPEVLWVCSQAPHEVPRKHASAPNIMLNIQLSNSATVGSAYPRGLPAAEGWDTGSSLDGSSNHPGSNTPLGINNRPGSNSHVAYAARQGKEQLLNSESIAESSNHVGSNNRLGSKSHRGSSSHLGTNNHLGSGNHPYAFAPRQSKEQLLKADSMFGAVEQSYYMTTPLAEYPMQETNTISDQLPYVNRTSNPWQQQHQSEYLANMRASQQGLDARGQQQPHSQPLQKVHSLYFDTMEPTLNQQNVANYGTMNQWTDHPMMKVGHSNTDLAFVPSGGPTPVSRVSRGAGTLFCKANAPQMYMPLSMGSSENLRMLALDAQEALSEKMRNVSIAPASPGGRANAAAMFSKRSSAGGGALSERMRNASFGSSSPGGRTNAATMYSKRSSAGVEALNSQSVSGNVISAVHPGSTAGYMSQAHGPPIGLQHYESGQQTQNSQFLPNNDYNQACGSNDMLIGHSSHPSAGMSEGMPLDEQLAVSASQDKIFGTPASMLPPRFSALPTVVQRRILELTGPTCILCLADFDDKVTNKLTLMAERYGEGECMAMLSKLSGRLKTKMSAMKNGSGYLDVASIVHQLKKLPIDIASERLKEVSARSYRHVYNISGCIKSTLSSRNQQHMKAMVVPKIGSENWKLETLESP
eukprot:gene103-5514_t